MISPGDFNRLIELLGSVATDDIQWAETREPPIDAEEFALETIYVICNSGMRFKVARMIYDRCVPAIRAGRSATTVFGHKGKAGAIDEIWADRERYFAEFMVAADKVEYAKTLPWIGSITAYHVAKNFGAQVAKPDVHLQRLADRECTTAQALCERLSAATGYKVPTIDTILWRACALGILSSATGEIRS